MQNKYFLDIPVYRLPEDRYYKERDSHVKKKMYPGSRPHDDIKRRFHEKYPEQKLNLEQHIREIYGGAWDYNEIIGWIQLHFLGSQIRGEYWCVKAKKIVRSRKKVFEWRAWKLAPEVDIPQEANNTDILRLINEYLFDCKEELPSRYLDISKLDIIGLYVDWRALINST